MKLELTITGKNKDQIMKRLLTITKNIIDDMYQHESESIYYTLKK
tara:strand:+ start:409 stop:543 length:135 start_codon:yes stop_codon:yes gene_type:complete